MILNFDYYIITVYIIKKNGVVRKLALLWQIMNMDWLGGTFQKLAKQMHGLKYTAKFKVCVSNYTRFLKFNFLRLNFTADNTLNNAIHY